MFFARVFTDLFNGIYNQQIDPSKARNVIISIFAVIVFSVVAFGSLNYFKDKDFKEIVEIKEPKVEKKLEPQVKIKKPEVKKEVKKPDVKKEVKPKLEVKRNNVDEVILPNLNLKTETVLNLFKDVEYDLGQVRSQKLVKPIYFTQFQEILTSYKVLN